MRFFRFSFPPRHGRVAGPRPPPPPDARAAMQSLRAYRNPRRAISIEALLVWTFRTQRAELEPPQDRAHARPGVGTEWIIFQRGAVLGCTIDCSRRVLPRSGARRRRDGGSRRRRRPRLADGDPRRRARPGRPAPDLHHRPGALHRRRVAPESARPLAGRRARAARQVSRRRVAPGDEEPQGPRTLRGLLHAGHLRPDPATGSHLAARLSCLVGRAPRGSRAPSSLPPVLRDHKLTAAMPPAWPWEGAHNQSEKVG